MIRTEEPGMVSHKEKLSFYAIQAAIVFLLLAVVFVVWSLTHDPRVTAATFLVALIAKFVSDSALPIILDRLRRGRFASRQLSLLRRNDVNDRLRAVAGLLWLGNDAAKIINAARQYRLPESVEREAQRELDKYVLPGLTVAMRDADLGVRLSAGRALEEIRSRQPLFGRI